MLVCAIAAPLLAAPWYAPSLFRVPAAPAPNAVAGDSARGQRLVATYQCGTCHDIPGAASARGTTGPTLQGIARRSYIAGEVPNRSGALGRWIIDPGSLVHGTPMPALGVSPRDAQDIVAYLATLK